MSAGGAKVEQGGDLFRVAEAFVPTLTFGSGA
jgi:hypothetical protein